MKAIRTFTVRPVLADSLAPLDRLASNWRWSWSRATHALFASMDPALWDEIGANPARMLGALGQERLDELARDDAFVARVCDEDERLTAYLEGDRWFQRLEGDKPVHIAYFSPEFGVDGSLPQYSGGLGILAGDHLKSASDLGVPLTGVGLFYRAGYFRQSIGDDGWQRESYPLLDPYGLGLTLLRDRGGAPVEIALDLPGDRRLHARVWVADIGRVPLLLLDSETPSNTDDMRRVTDRLYGGGGEHRLLQELLLGVGGVRAVRAWSELTGRPAPDVYHTNEGHAGFQGLERMSELITQDGLSFDEALAQVRAGTVFTTHTPVPAGIDRFPRDLIADYLASGLFQGLDAGRAIALGLETWDGGDQGVFNMAVLGLHLGQHANGVSVLHGEVSRGMFGMLWPGVDTDEVPITSITNGVHAPTWVHPALKSVSERAWGDAHTDTHDWTDRGAVSDAELWGVRQQMKGELVAEARRRVAASVSNGHTPSWVEELLDPEVLTIGFARRVPTYKRLTLMLRDPERLTKLLTDPERPVQIVIGGKSHPADDSGKILIQQLVRFSRDPKVRGRIVFLPDYDIALAKDLYPGCDVWLNNPLRPLEACGTSGMKAALNGALNLSILDGWWDEWFDGRNGWAIPTADTAANDEERDDAEAAALYDLIEHQLVPRFYEREGGIPTAWLDMVRHTMTELGTKATSDRMVRDYVQRLYVPAAAHDVALRANGFLEARAVAAFVGRVTEAWGRVSIASVDSSGIPQQAQAGDTLEVRADVRLDGLSPDDVAVELAYGRTDEDDALARDHSVYRLSPGAAVDGVVTFTGTLPLTVTGTFGYTVRVRPAHPRLVSPVELGLVTYAS
ncbi:alpha-glucan family phosphorylase [Microbacterium sp. M3]|uniref:glycogen phosphorylase n=1 Tax=Microbacterium arthrosphaerae TaxID=792652 RepID=A0ABU4H0M9_9MICO|nr:MULTISPECIES: alpha-glucan family phosphorylase [Microbacterium]MDW4572249.1 alpha-glucan family phosphorylase [Microbacterium arthrosphaerae]MDW7606104.1 alpha-glucan family phosphorylase [Microbacterium sp. M3]